MKGKPYPGSRRVPGWAAAALLLAGLVPWGNVQAQSGAPPAKISLAAEDPALQGPPPTPAAPGEIQLTGCPGCGGGASAGGSFPYGPGGHCGPYCDGGCGCGEPGQCVPGRYPCDCCCDPSTLCGRLANGFYRGVCCPDPCYEGKWIAIADAAFFQDGARPKTQMKIRFDQGWSMNFPDRAEYYWARADGKGRGPTPPPANLDVSDFHLYTEAAAGRFGLFVDMPYRRNEGDNGFTSSGFGDVFIGTKSMLLDAPLVQITFQFTTFIPSGSAGKGVGTGHTSLEPALLWGFRLAENTFLQAETALWIPVGGDSQYAGNIFHYHLALNQLLWRPCCDLQLVGTVELNGWVVLSGEQTDPATLIPVTAGPNLVSAGPGLRFVLCDRIDFGLGSAFALSTQRWAEEQIRFDFRWRF